MSFVFVCLDSGCKNFKLLGCIQALPRIIIPVTHGRMTHVIFTIFSFQIKL